MKSTTGEEDADQTIAKIMDILENEVMDLRTLQHRYPSQKGLRKGEHADTPITVAHQKTAGADIQ